MAAQVNQGTVTHLDHQDMAESHQQIGKNFHLVNLIEPVNLSMNCYSAVPQPLSKRSKDRKKKLKSTIQTNSSTNVEDRTSVAQETKTVDSTAVNGAGMLKYLQLFLRMFTFS